MKMRWNLLWVPAYILLFGVTGCSAPGEQNLSPKTYHVEIRQMSFSPAAITVSKGDTVMFINNDLVDHNITEEDKQTWSSSTLHPGQLWSKEITENANYYCSLHAVMKGKITVR